MNQKQPKQAQETFSSKKFKLMIYMTALSAGALLISNLAAVKLWNMGGIAVDGGLVLFPLTYILSDLIVELYGKDRSRSVIYAGFLVNVIAALVFYVVIALPPYPGWDMQEAYAMVLGFSPRIILGSLSGYLTSSLLNNYLFEKMRASSGIFARSFIARALTSSVFAHILDTIVFETIAFLGVLSFQEFLMQALFAYILGMGLEFVLSPVEIAIEKALKKWLNEKQ
ncbi:queuosine precursor transporter [Allobaculum fili]|uniref:queuosine precursor transporter n=2 Tax=Erysipelotrichaceae TaxID=128827 RepID=UPI001E3A7648|nr:queuosine precursor transporter [Allobaculum fili]